MAFGHDHPCGQGEGCGQHQCLHNVGSLFGGIICTASDLTALATISAKTRGFRLVFAHPAR
jgi:hypothetical protein